MSLVKRIREEQLTARKQRSADASILTVLLGEAEKIGKDKGNRETSDDEVILVVRRLLKTGIELKSLFDTTDSMNPTANAEKLAETIAEINLLESFLPAQLGDAEIVEAAKEIVDEVGATTMKQMGQVMGILKKKFGNSLNMAIASKAVKDLLS